MVLVTLAAALFGYESYVSWKEQRAVREIEKLYGSVKYKHIGPEWLRRFAGEDYLKRVTGAMIHAATTDDILPYLRDLRALTETEVVSGLAQDELVTSSLEANLPDVNIYLVPWQTRAPQMYPGTSWLFPTEALSIELAGIFDAPRKDSMAVRKALGKMKHSCGGYWELIVRPADKDYLLLVGGDFSAGFMPHEVWSTFFLLRDGQLVDWKSLNYSYRPLRPSLKLVVDDLNGNGITDIGLERTSRTSVQGLPPRARKIVNETRLWHEAYEITPTGFKSLFEENDR